MTDYYEFLEIMSTAQADEIERAIEEKYHKWRRLVTHHDHNVADEANRTLHTLEEARGILLDPANKSQYDQTLRTGGLADPQAVPVLRTPPPPPPPSSVATKTTDPIRVPEPRVDAWVCAKCGTPNKTGQLYCKQCGSQLGRECPICSTLNETSAPFCSSCGTSFSDALRAVQEDYVRQIQYEIQSHLTEINKIEQTRGALGNLLSSISSGTRQYWPYLLGGYAVLFLLSLVVADQAFVAPLLCLTVLVIPMWFIGHQQLSRSIGQINTHRQQIEELEANMLAVQRRSIGEG